MSDQPGEARPAGPDPGRRQRSPWLVLLGILIVSAGGLLLVNALRDWLSTPRPAPEQDLAAEARADLERRNFVPLSGALEALLADPKYQPVATQTHPLLGQAAPDFTLADVEKKEWTLAQQLRDGPVVLVFYYGYHCDHCVSQLFALHKDIEKFRELGAKVVAVSADPPEQTRERFEKYGAFAFPVLSDPGNKVAEKYGTFAPSPKPGEDGNLMHGTFVINRQGRVVWTNRGDTPFTENRTLLVEVQRCERPLRSP